ncbi:hypothetical protein A6V39_04040 [Candidatus Mycoplasma haematobovis]|uniref:Uncharacterized protein n=2 Tax=Candidatus Mycoplasma haematobovis TaxID=432608 RepID=A0A1A9QEC8_9MOLU|nr:hypothetical protein A6V39_04040 [Candidatus Mycoplasma haematobovis]
MKTVSIGVAGCAIAAGIGLTQAKSSSTIRERLGLEGYELVSDKSSIEAEVWKTRATLYKDNAKNQDLLFDDLLPANVKTEGTEIKEKCNSFTSGKMTVDSVGTSIYDKIVKLCTLDIKEYIKSHLSSGDAIMESNGAEEDWKEIFGQHKDQITQKYSDASETNAREKLSNFCNEIYLLKHSNKNRDDSSNAKSWCVKKAKPTTQKPSASTDGDTA